MRRTLLACLALLVALPAFAVTTWSTVDPLPIYPASLVRIAKLAESTGTGDAPTNPVRASQTFTCAATAAGDTATIRGFVFTGRSDRNDSNYFLIGGTDNATCVNLAAAINRYSSSLQVYATVALTVLTLKAVDYGTAQNAWTTVGTAVRLAAGGATMASGTAVVGLNTYGVKAVSVYVEAAVGAMTAGGKLLAYVLNPASSVWMRLPEMDITVTALQNESYTGLEVLGDYSYLAYVPSGVGRATELYLVGRMK